MFTTSGTTGRRGVVPQTRAEFGQWVDAARRTLHRAGMDATARTVGIAAPTPLHITQKLFGALGGFGGGRPALAATMPVPELVQALNADRPALMLTIPSVAGVLAGEQLDGRLAIHLRGIVLAGEILPDDVITRIEAAWGIAPIQVYAATEALMLASESVDRVGLQVNEDLVVLEVVDERHRPVAPGRPGYKVLITSLVGRAVPLIRYELIRIQAGAPFRRIERVDGRNDDQLGLPARSGGEAVILPHHLRAPFATLPDVLQYQIIHTQQRLVIRFVLHPRASAETPERAVAAIRAALDAADATAPPIEVETVSEIERESGGAKVKLVKSR